MLSLSSSISASASRHQRILCMLSARDSNLPGGNSCLQTYWQGRGTGKGADPLSSLTLSTGSGTCFSKRFLQLRDLPKLNLPGWELDAPPMFKDVARHPQDVVMVCKQFWASDRLAQPPLLWIPHAWFVRLSQIPGARVDRNTLSDRQVKEYRKNSGGGGSEAVVPAPRGDLPGKMGGRQRCWDLWVAATHRFPCGCSL